MKQDHKTRSAFARFTCALTAALLLSPLAASAEATKPAAKLAPAIELGTRLKSLKSIAAEMVKAAKSAAIECS
jgi:hypothetical protein